jgi:NTE family protein
VPIETPQDPSDPTIVLAFSGGGSRAAALSLSVLDELARYSYVRHDGSRVRLIDQVKIVSSVSGGSVTAAWFGLVGPERMDELRDRFLAKNNMATLEWEAANPITWARLAFSRFTRMDAFTKLLDDRLFGGYTFAEIAQPGKPRIFLNATDMSSGEVFSFTPEHFDDICSDLNALPISAGVASSAAFPIALSPYNLKDYNAPSVGPCKGAIPVDQWIAKDLGTPAGSDQATRYIDLEEFKRARYANALRNGPQGYRPISYLHLLDGGLADNQGGHSIVESLTIHSATRLLYDLNSGRANRVVVIAVNSRSDPGDKLSVTADVPDTLDELNAVVSIPIDATTAYSNSSVQLLVDQLNTLRDEQAAAQKGDTSAPDPIRVYNISVDFDQFHNDQASLRDKLKAIGTSWNLSGPDLGIINEAGGMLLRQHPCFEHLLQDLKIKAPFVDPTFVKSACRLNGDPEK